MRRTHPNRRGFTLIELLVAAALSLVVMTVLSLAFQTGMQTLSQLKSVVGLAEQLRAAEGVMRRDLLAYHLEADQGLPVRVSDGGGIKGFFSFTQGGMVQLGGGPQGAGPLDEKLGVATADSPTSFRTQPANLASQLFGRAWMDTLAFTVRLDGTRPQEVFITPAGGLLAKLRIADATALPVETQSADPTITQLTSRWAEVSYLLIPSGGTPRVFTSDEGGVTALPLYTLYRRQRVLADHTVTSGTFVAADITAARGVATALSGSTISVLGPEAVAKVVDNRLGGKSDPLAPALVDASNNPLPVGPLRDDLQRRGYPIPQGNTESGSDVLLNNVVSMTVRPVYEFDVSNAVAQQLSPYFNGSVPQFTPVPRQFQAPSYSPTDWLELVSVTGTAGTRTPLAAPATAQFPRFFDTAGPSSVGVVFRSVGTGAPLNITWDPGLFELSAKLKAIEIKLRVYDAKNKTTRQMTVFEDL